MKSKHLLLLGAAFCNLFTAVDSLHAQGTAFTYQGRLDDNGNSANGIYDFRFTIYAAASGGSIAGGSVDAGDVGVTNGQFALPLDFGSSPFSGGDRWLDIAVRPGASNGDFTNLVPRQKITATPYAIRAANFSGVVTASQLTGTISSQNIANGTITANMLAAGSVGTTQLADGSITAGKIASGAVSGDLWTPTGAGAPSARYDHTAVWTGTEMIVWGGYSGSHQLNDGARYNPALNTWTAINTNGAPAGRSLHTAVWTGTEMIIWGGNGETTHLNDGARYNPVSDTWTAINASGAPGARRYHTAIWTGTEMFVWGGGIGGGIQGVTKFNDGGRYHPSSDTWTPINPGNAPVARYLHTAVWTGNEMIIWGGLGVSYLGDGARYNPTGNSWTALNPTGAPAPRSSHTAVWTGTRMIVFGGAGAGNFNGGASYDLTGNGWTTTAGTTSPRFLHSAVWTGSEMFVWGGSAGVGPVNTGERYNPVTDAWTTFPTTGSPSARYRHTAIWSGTEMIVWGGTDNGSFNDGARFRLSNIVPASIGSAQLAAPLHFSGATPSGSTLSGANSASEGAGVAGISTGGTTGVGVSGDGGIGTGVKGIASGFSGIGVSGISATGTGVSGDSTSGSGVIGSTTTGRGVWGISYGSGLAGRFEGDVVAYGNVQAQRGGFVGELGGALAAVEGRGPGGGTGVLGIGGSPNGIGVSGIAGVNGYGIYGSGYYAGWFAGAVNVTGGLSKAGGNFRIDHPLDPANKYLSHSFVESPDMMNIYNGNITLDAKGEAVVAMPEWFSALNKEFRYQLTCLGSFAPVFIAEEIANNRFKIAGGKSGLKVSWQVTGVRQDAWANAHRIPIEEDKPAKERGSYLHPAEIGQPTEKSVEWARHPETMRQRKERPVDSSPERQGIAPNPESLSP